MPNDHQILNDLRQCMKQAHGDPAKMTDCQTTFEAAQGTTVDGGKVFTAFVTDGGKVFKQSGSVAEGGKVFGTADGNVVFVSSNGNKVLDGGKVF